MLREQELTLKHPDQPETVRTPANNRRVRELALEHERKDEPTSTRRLALELREGGHPISKSTVHTILTEDLKLKAYHRRRTFKLKPPDRPRRVAMARKLLEMIDEDSTLLERIIWTDEAKFTLVGCVNTHDTIYWSPENPHETIDTERINQMGITVWAGIWAGDKIGPTEIQGTLTGHKYLDVLREEIIPWMDQLRRHWLMQDGAQCHTARVVKSYLQEIFGERVIAAAWDPE